MAVMEAPSVDAEAATALSHFHAELAAWGPDADPPRPTLRQSQQYTRLLAARHYENFPVLSVFVPRRLRQSFADVYAYCRWSDDLGDELASPAEATRHLAWWQEQLLALYQPHLVQQVRHPVLIALAATIERHAIPPTPFLDLLRAFRRDQQQTRYETFDDLLDYCRYSANPVGRLVLYLCDRHTPDRWVRSDAVCTGLQLANFWQDVGEDYERGRIYLPIADCRRFGVDEAHIASRSFDPSFAKLMEYQVHRAEQYLRRGLPLAGTLPGRLQTVIALFAHGGLGICRKIRQQQFNVLAARPRMSKADVASIFFRALVR